MQSTIVQSLDDDLTIVHNTGERQMKEQTWAANIALCVASHAEAL